MSKNPSHMTDLFERAEAIARHVRGRVGVTPWAGLVLGSGLGAFVEGLADARVIAYEEIPGFPVSTVAGHAGNLVFAEHAGRPIVVMQGRVHYYEVSDMATATLPIRVLGRLGIETLVVTNSAGAVNRRFSAGDLMLIEDQLNLMGANPLLGPNDERFGPRFPDMTHAYDPGLRERVIEAAMALGIPLQRGVYCALSGPAYETPAEIRMLGMLGADAVGMSTAPEVIVANQMGIRCVGISCISNLAAGISPHPLSHEEVKETAARVSHQFVALVTEALTRMMS